jgi:glycosyltransferase involved in cell wall biosynthesis
MGIVKLRSAAGAESPWCFDAGLSVFFPAFNDAKSLPSLLAKTFATLERVASDYEVIVVNDGSADETAQVLEELSLKYSPFLRIVTHPQNRGYGAALRSGFAAATKDFIFYTDGDGQYDPAELELLLHAASPEIGLVNGFKIERHDPLHRVVIGKAYNWLVRRMFGIQIRDVDCDFRLIRRSELDVPALQSTGGTICVELVHSLEQRGIKVAEVPVHHFPRLNGRSEFFRIKSLVRTFQQLCELFGRRVIEPQLAKGATLPNAMLVIASVIFLSLLTYGRTVTLPFISDDYLQIQLGRDYGPVSGWNALLGDALYRCRATSIILTHWTEELFGLVPLAFTLSSLIVHIANSCMVLLLGLWRPIGWKISAVAACFFAVSQRHSEAVVWYAALPELLVFFFAIASFLCWVCWLQSEKLKALSLVGSLVFFGLALLSKESAVALVPLLALAAWIQPGKRTWQAFCAVSLYGIASAVYFALAYVARDTHLHFNDGTFSLAAPFWSVLIRSGGNLLWVWGLVGIVALYFLKPDRWKTIVLIALAWIAAMLLPYSFLTYMPRVPSRHTYLASVGLSIIVAAAILALRTWAKANRKTWLIPAVAGLIIVHQSTYVMAFKHPQYAMRAEPTERLVELGRQMPGGTIYAKCFPYPTVIARRALELNAIEASLVAGREAQDKPGAVDFCNSAAHE